MSADSIFEGESISADHAGLTPKAIYTILNGAGQLEAVALDQDVARLALYTGGGTDRRIFHTSFIIATR